MQQFHYLRVFFFSVFSLGGAVRAIIGLLHADMHQRGTVGSVCHLATSVITVAPGMKGDEAVAKLTKRSKSGKVMQDVSCVSFGMTVLFLHCYILLTLVCFFCWSSGGGFQYQRGSYSHGAEQAQSCWRQTE